ncbi:MAG: 50S ribosomal protein L19 [bacterium]
MTKLIEKVNKLSLKPASAVDAIEIGSQVDVHVKISEGGKDRIQIYSGTVIARKGRSSTETFTVRRISHGVGVERVFPMHSPNVVKVETVKGGRVRRAKLYYLRNLRGKKAKLKEFAPTER